LVPELLSATAATTPATTTTVAIVAAVLMPPSVRAGNDWLLTVGLTVVSVAETGAANASVAAIATRESFSC